MAQRGKTAHPDRERLFLIDGMAIAYRAYFSFINNPLINSRGENTSAIYGFVHTLMMILADEHPEHIAVCFDTRHPTFRHVMYEPYKATREKMPDDMASQLDTMKSVIQAFNVPLLELPGYEADDIMGTLARQAEKDNVQTLLVTGDKDFMQLISSHIRMYKPGKRGDEWEILDEKAVEAKFGVTPDRVIDVLGLIGDKSDNVPGVPGIGEKTAIPLVQRYGSMESILDHVDDIAQKGVQTKLREHRELALLSKKLVTIDTNVPIDVDIHKLKAKDPDRARLAELFTHLEFKSLSKKFAGPSTESPSAKPVALAMAASEPEPVVADATPLKDISSTPHKHHVVSTEKELKALAALLAKSKEFVFDTETTSTNPLTAALVGIAIAIKSGEAWYIPVQDEPTENAGLFQTSLYDDVLSVETAKKYLAPIFANPKIGKIGQNIKFDMLALSSHDMPVEGIAFDTMVASYVVRADGERGMDAMAAEHLRYKTITFDDLTGTGRNRKDIREIEIAKVAEYSAEDADITWQLYEIMNDKLKKLDLLKFCTDLEFPLIDVLADMEIAGIKLDEKFLREFSKELERVLGQLTGKIHGCSGEQFNINSTQQLSRILFEKLGLASGKKTKTGYSTDIGVLESLHGKHEIIDYLLEFRQLQKLKSTYADALTSLINPKTGRVHTSFNQTVAATGRLSSTDPNLQNIPIKTDLGRSLRKAFIPGGKDFKIVAADYSQIELRLMAHFSGDEAMTAAFMNGEDIHTTTAAKVFGVSGKEVTREMRRKAKEVNFGIMYGIGPFGLSNRLDISQAEAKDIILKYNERFPKVKQYIGDTIAKAREDGYVCTLWGRRRYLPDVNNKNAVVRANAERQAINMPIQGSAADMIKKAMIDIHAELKRGKLKASMLLQVHDELVFEVKESDIPKAQKMIVDKMKNAMKLSVPVEVECGNGKSWFEAH